MVPVTIQVPETRFREENRTIFETEYKDEVQTITRIKMEQRNITRPVVVYQMREVKEKKVRLVKRVRKTKKRVPANMNVTFSCPCYE